MTRPAASLLLLTLSVSLAACTPDSAPDSGNAPDDAVAEAPHGAAKPEPNTPDATEGTCNADTVQSLVGRQIDDALIEQARTDAGAETVRVLEPGQMMTMDYRADRLNIEVDDANAITALRCG